MDHRVVFQRLLDALQEGELRSVLHDYVQGRRDRDPLVHDLCLVLAHVSVPKFDWVAWGKTDHAVQLCHDVAAVRSASSDEIRKLATLHVRADRFNGGYLESLCQERAEYLAALLARCAELE